RAQVRPGVVRVTRAPAIADVAGGRFRVSRSSVRRPRVQTWRSGAAARYRRVELDAFVTTLRRRTRDLGVVPQVVNMLGTGAEHRRRQTRTESPTGNSHGRQSFDAKRRKRDATTL